MKSFRELANTTMTELLAFQTEANPWVTNLRDEMKLLDVSGLGESLNPSSKNP